MTKQPATSYRSGSLLEFKALHPTPTGPNHPIARPGPRILLDGEPFDIETFCRIFAKGLRLVRETDPRSIDFTLED